METSRVHRGVAAGSSSNVLGTAAPKSRVISALKRDYFLKMCGIQDRPLSPAFRNSGI
jgi:hypothetical protein